MFTYNPGPVGLSRGQQRNSFFAHRLGYCRGDVISYRMGNSAVAIDAGAPLLCHGFMVAVGLGADSRVFGHGDEVVALIAAL